MTSTRDSFYPMKTSSSHMFSFAKTNLVGSLSRNAAGSDQVTAEPAADTNLEVIAFAMSF